MASLLMAGCSQEEISPSGGEEGNDDGNTSYMCVNLISSDNSSRALAGYENGTKTENNVKNVRFYFFTANGAPANVKLLNGSYVNYYDWSPGTGDQSWDNPDSPDSDDIESKLKATIVISTKDGDKLPQGIVAVLNPPMTNDVIDLGSGSKSLSDLKAIYRDYVTGLTEENKFVMFNSVYGNSAKTAEICAVPIESNNLQKKQDDALKPENVVTIYVERSVAKVRVTLGDNVKAAAATDNMLALKDKEGNDLKIGNEQVYLKLIGWDLTAETDKGRLVKSIDLSWTQNWWNGAHRSFWAINAPTALNKYYNYKDINNSFTASLYTNENALDYTSNETTNSLNRTKVILKGTLCKENGNSFTIVRHLGAHFADDPSTFAALKANILRQLGNSVKYYYKTDEDGREQIGTDDIEIVIATQTPAENSKNCYVYAKLTTAAESKIWYNSTDATADPIAFSTINSSLQNKDIVDQALVWNNGMTYYYYEIIHNGTGENATKGVVRNHIYDTTVTGIAGYGTPVYNPDQIIYPEKPDPNDHYIAAQINILSWRIVENDYNLEW